MHCLVLSLCLPCCHAQNAHITLLLCCFAQSLRRRMRPGQRPPSRFQAEAADLTQAQAAPHQFASADVTTADNTVNITCLIEAWDPLELASMMRQVSAPRL